MSVSEVSDAAAAPAAPARSDCRAPRSEVCRSRARASRSRAAPRSSPIQMRDSSRRPRRPSRLLLLLAPALLHALVLLPAPPRRAPQIAHRATAPPRMVVNPSYLLAGGVCASLSHALATPIDVIKTRQQTMSSYRSLSFKHAFQRCYREGRAAALLLGLGPTRRATSSRARSSLGRTRRSRSRRSRCWAPSSAPGPPPRSGRSPRRSPAARSRRSCWRRRRRFVSHPPGERPRVRRPRHAGGHRETVRRGARRQGSSAACRCRTSSSCRTPRRRTSRSTL